MGLNLVDHFRIHEVFSLKMLENNDSQLVDFVI